MAPKSKTAKSSSKKRNIDIGHKTQDDEDLLTSKSVNLPSSSAWSTRTLPLTHVLPLSTLCLKTFSVNLQKIHSSGNWQAQVEWLKLLPDSVIPRLFATLRQTCPSILSSNFITAYLLRGPSVTLTDDLPGVNKNTVAAIIRSGEHLKELVLRGLDKIPDENFASVIAQLPVLQVLVLSGCTKVGSKTVAAISQRCPNLTKLNLNYTSATPISLAPVLKLCAHLNTLKLAGISNWTEATIGKLWAALGDDTEGDTFYLPNLTNINLRQLSISDFDVNQVLTRCPNIQKLDLSFTPIHHPPLLLTPHPNLEKLSLTSTQISSADIISILTGLPNLKSLSAGAIGGGQGSSVAISNTSAMTLTDQTLREITDILVEYNQLESVSLVGNTKLGSVGRIDRAFEDFVKRVGRKCKHLNLAGISSLKSSDLSGLLIDDIELEPSKLQELVLNNTGVNDEVAPYISACPNLQTLELGSTKISEEGLFTIIDSCSQLSRLNLTSCRGVGVVDRRRFFEVWEER
ncbi:Leucine-rich repeat domain superfamily protein [Abortiporus biennis]